MCSVVTCLQLWYKFGSALNSTSKYYETGVTNNSTHYVIGMLSVGAGIPITRLFVYVLFGRQFVHRSIPLAAVCSFPFVYCHAPHPVINILHKIEPCRGSISYPQQPTLVHTTLNHAVYTLSRFSAKTRQYAVALRFPLPPLQTSSRYIRHSPSSNPSRIQSDQP